MAPAAPCCVCYTPPSFNENVGGVIPQINIHSSIESDIDYDPPPSLVPIDMESQEVLIDVADGVDVTDEVTNIRNVSAANKACCIGMVNFGLAFLIGLAILVYKNFY